MFYKSVPVILGTLHCAYTYETLRKSKCLLVVSNMMIHKTIQNP